MSSDHTAHRPAASFAALARLGALLGALSVAWLVLLQTSAAALARMLWAVDTPLLNAVLQPLAGALLGALLALAVEVLRRRFWPSLEPRAAVAGCLALLVYAGRSGATALLRGRQGMVGGRWGAALVQGAVVLALLALTVAWLQRRQLRREERDPGGMARPLLCDALAVACCTTTAALCVQLHWLAVKEQARIDGWLGPPALLLTALAGLAGLALALALAEPLGRWTRAARARVISAALVGAVFLAMGLLDQRPAAGTLPSAGSVAGPNVLLVVLDTLRRDAVSAYGAVQGTTPAFDVFADQGLLYDDCLANGCWTVPSHASLFTGAEVGRHGAGHLRERLRLRPGGPGSAPLPTLAEVLSLRGYDTAAFVCNMNVSRANGFARGFAEYQEVWRARQGDYDLLGQVLRAFLGEGVFDKGGALCLAGSRDWLADHAADERPWFLFVNMMEAHSPYYRAPPRFARSWLKDDEPGAGVAALLTDVRSHVYRGGLDSAAADELWRIYLGGVAYQDWLLGRLLAELDARGLADDTVVLITSDHGENIGWQGLLGHGQDLNDELLRVPLAVRGPGVPVGLREPTPVSLVDLAPTVLSLVGAPALAPDPGRSGVALLGMDAVDSATLADRLRWLRKYPMFRHDLAEYSAHSDGGDPSWAWGRRGLLRGRDKLVLLDRAADGVAGVLVDSLASGETKAALSLRWLLDHPPWPPAQEPEARGPLDEDELAALRALGYVGEEQR